MMEQSPRSYIPSFVEIGPLVPEKIFMPPTLKKLMGHIAFGAWVRACVGGSHFLYLL